MELHKDEPTGNSFVKESEYNLLMTPIQVSVSRHILDSHFTLLWANDFYYQIFGYPREEYEAEFHNQCDLLFKDAQGDWKELTRAASEAYAGGKKGWGHILRMRGQDGNMMCLQIVGSFTDQLVNGCQSFYMVMTDIGQLMRMRGMGEEQDVTIDDIPGLIAKFRITETGTEFISANDRFLQFFKSRQACPAADLCIRENRAVYQSYFGMMRDGKPVQFTITLKDENGDPEWLHLSGECIDWIGRDPIYLFSYMDITDITRQREMFREANKRFERLAFVDSVTGGDNLTCFELEVSEVLKAASTKEYALVWLDIQKFKLINDLYGTEAGNMTLKHVYQVICSFLKVGEYAARTSADNFSILLKTTSKSDIMARINAIAEEVNRFNLDAERKYILPLTAGVYIVDDPWLPIMQIQDRANTARKSTKVSAQASLCSCVFYSELDWLKLMREKDMENRMQDALKDGEFIIHLQPKQSLKSQMVAGAEALVRWMDSESGLIPPDEFIPFFEKNKFIIKLDLYVFERVCALLRRWMDAGVEPIPISVNMSRAHLTEREFLERYEKVRRQYDIPAKLLEIELTETLVFENRKALLQVIGAFQKCGYHVSMDDFGSGYSSLNVLKDVDMDTLKLDRAFLGAEEADNPRERDVITSVIQLAKRLDMTTVAEGVETRAQARFLKEAGCDLIQGYVFSRPIPIKEFEKMVFGKEIS